MSRSRKPSEATGGRIAPLATLPLFFGLRDRPVLVIGGSAAAAWKAELLLAAGARVTVIDEVLAPDTRQLLEAQGALRHRGRTWRDSDLERVVLVVADVDSEEEADRLFTAAQAHGVPCNVIDQPAFCDFTFGSIVNRSPVVVGISTAGAAPVLGQAIRRRIEALLPRTLGAWAMRAAELRRAVTDRIGDAAGRRRAWARFAERALSGAPVDKAGDLLLDRAPAAGGRVTLVGAGPGDAELLTLKAVRALQAADVVLFDALVSDDVLDLARREARRMLVGKRGHRPSCRQEDINETMLTLARQGHHVVRLKSGDPMIFGRAGEEIAALRDAGITVDIVPGITTALAAAAELGVSLTHRDMAQSLQFVTGHARNGELPDDVDWRALANGKTTLMVYMGGRTAPELGRRLMAAGLPAAIPVAVLTSVSRPEQRTCRTTVAALAAGGSRIDEGPVLIGIGEVFGQARAVVREGLRELATA